ncbi:MAG: transketolase [Patescibacteria group bacterium]
MSDLTKVLKQIQANILLCSTAAGSGHPTSSLSAAHIMTAIFFTKMRFDIKNPKNIHNDRLIFSKGHASPLYYSLYRGCGVISQEELMTFRQFTSRLEGHPSTRFPFVEAMTGSLGQGIGIAVGEAIAIKKRGSAAKVYCLMGDSELSEGSCYEAFNSASYYNLDNLIAIIDMNRLGQRGPTQLGHDTTALKKRLESFGLDVFVVENGNNMDDCFNTLHLVTYASSKKPKVIIARTQKGYGINSIVNKDGWHGKALSKEECKLALKEFGEVDVKYTHPILGVTKDTSEDMKINPSLKAIPGIATRKAYGEYLNSTIEKNPQIMVLDAEVSNSTFVDVVNKNYPNNFLEMFIAEQNMISVATGLSKLGFVPFCSTFAAFFSRAFDQIRMAQYSDSILNLAGSHCGVSIGADGPSQMALEDIAMMRSIHDSWVLYPCDSISAMRLTSLMSTRPKGINYIRLTRDYVSDIYDEKSDFYIGGSNVLSDWSEVAILCNGITVFEALKVNKIMPVTVIDMYSVKPIDIKRVEEVSKKCKIIIVVEDHHLEGGLYEAVLSTGKVNIPIHSLSVNQIPRSGTREELMKFCKIDKDSILDLISHVY